MPKRNANGPLGGGPRTLFVGVLLLRSPGPGCHQTGSPANPVSSAISNEAGLAGPLPGLATSQPALCARQATHSLQPFGR